MSVAAAAGSWARASREFQRGVEVMSVSAARVMAIEIEEKKKRKRKGLGNTIAEIFKSGYSIKRICAKITLPIEEVFRREPALYL